MISNIQQEDALKIMKNPTKGKMMDYDNNDLFFIKTNLLGIRVSLFDVATWKNGLAFKNIDFSDNGKPVIKIAELNNGISSNTAYTRKEYSSDVFITKGDLLFSWSGNPETSIDIYKYNLLDGWLNQHIFKVAPKKSMIDKNFFYYVMKFLKPNFTKIATNKQTTGLGHVTLQDIKRISIIIPSLVTQKKIAGVLGALDDKIELNNKINQNLEAQAQALFKSWFVDKKYEIEKNVTLGAVCKCELGGTPSRIKPEYWNGNMSWINSGAVNNFRIIKASEYITETGLQHSATKLLPKKTTVLAITGATLGQISLLEIDSCANQSVVGILENEILPYEFIYPYICYNIKELLSHQTGGAQQHINKQNVEQLALALPKSNVVNEYRNIVSPIFELIANNCFENERLVVLRDTLLPKLMKGEIDVSSVSLRGIE